MYLIGMFSKINRVTIKTLRYYDEVGLLKPAYVDKENGYRYYTSEQLPQLHKILALRQIGLSIDEILTALNGRNVIEIFESRKVELQVKIEESKQQLKNITHYLKEIKEDFSMNYNVIVKDLPSCIVYSKRMTIPNYDAYFKLIPKIGEEVAKANPNLKCVVPEYCFVIYHDGEYKEKDIDVEYCEAVTSWGTDTDTIKFKQMEKIPMAACLLHKGPYKTLGNGYAHIFRWIADNDYTVADNPRESYIDGIWNKDDENEWLTEIQVPITKK